MLESSYSEKELQKIILDDIDCNYFYPNEWSSCRNWLLNMLLKLKNS
ncbi:MAG: hypothetical protein J6563_01205 [Gilliamella sp.]|nr:hypothetical protein [Gilliamella sp.]MCO6559898.1 hypothetical protein [Gilliamella sp.]